MAHNITIPFYGFKLKFASGGNLFTPMMHHQLVFADTTIYQMASSFRNAFQTKVIDKGEYKTIVDQYVEGEFFHGEVVVPFKGAKDRISYPDFELIYKYFFKKTDRGIWAVVPVLGLEVFTDEPTELEKALVDGIRLEFVRKDRLKSVQSIVETVWYDSVELLQEEINFKYHTLSELSKLQEEKAKEILPLVAQSLSVPRKILFGMEKEFTQLVRAMKGKFSRNTILVGRSGVGKTTLIWELARQRKKHNINSEIWETTASTMIKELTTDVGWQENLAYLCKDLNKRGDILFVRNLMELFEVGQYEGNAVSMAEYLRPYLVKGEITLISECTEEELAKIDLRSPNYSSLFNVIRIEEPKKDLEEIILKKVNDIALSSRLKIDSEAVKETLRLNKRYTPYSGFPGKPIRFLESIILNNKKNRRADDLDTQHIGRSEVIKYFCEDTGMPQFIVDPEMPMHPKKIRVDFKGDLFGQDHCVDAVVDILASVKTALTRQGKPIASFLFVGPTGVGKTEMAKILAKFMFGGRDKIIRFDMSEFSGPYSVIRLTGAGYNSEGLLTAAVRREPFAVVLFDEIEKADPSFYDLLLQVLGEGRLTDSQGKLVNFCSTIIIMTSNIGAQSLQGNRIGWSSEIDTADVNAHFVSSVEKHFRPELFNRIDRVLPFSPLGKETMRFVVEREMELFKKREGVKFRKMSLDIKEEVLDFIAVKGYDAKYGARYLQRAMREKLVTPLAKQLNTHGNDQLEVAISIEENEIAINIEADAMKLELMLEELQRDNSADISSDFRRNVYYLQEGNTYVKMLSELDMLEKKKRKKGERFWKNPQHGTDYTYYLEVKEKMKTITKEIEELEMELALAIMDLKPYRPAIIDEIKNWEIKYEQLKLDLFIKINSEYNTCHLSMMGKNPEWVFDFYLPLIKEKGYEISSAETLWFSDKYYNEQTKQKIEKEIDGEMKLVEDYFPRLDYEKIPFDPDDKNKFNFNFKKDKGMFIGIILKLKGPGVYLYFQHEQGRLDKLNTKKERSLFFIDIGVKDPIYSKTIHRKEYFVKVEPKARRIVEPFKIKDTKYKIDRDLPRGNHQEIIKSQLDKLFKKRLDTELMGEREE